MEDNDSLKVQMVALVAEARECSVAARCGVGAGTAGGEKVVVLER